MNAPGDPEVLKVLGQRRRSTARRWLWRAVTLLVVLGLAAGFVLWRRSRQPSEAERYVTAPVEFGTLRESVTATGTLSALDAVEVGAEVTGRVTKVHVAVNDRVTAGQVLVEIDTEQLSARVEEAQAQLQSARASQRNASATIKEAEATASRTRQLHARGLASDQDLETAEAALDRARASQSSSEAQVVVAQAALKASKTSLGKAIIRSPIDGIVLSRTVEEGQTVTAGFQTPVLLKLSRELKDMVLKVDVDEADVGKVREGQTATFVVDAYPKRRFSSKLIRLGNLPKPETTVVTYEAELTVDNADRLLRPGMTATATIVTSERPDVLSVPNAALRFEPPAPEKPGAPSRPLPLPGMRGMRGMRGGGRPPGEAAPARRDRVFLLDGQKLVPVNVEVGASDGRRTEISGPGISAGKPVVIDLVETPE